MLQQIGPTELIIVLVIVLLLFGAGRITRIGHEFGSAISAFRKELHDNEPDQMDDTAWQIPDS